MVSKSRHPNAAWVHGVVIVRITRAKFEWKVEDLWVGVFWKHGYGQFDDGPKRMWTDVWICFIPCVPLHLTVSHDVTIPFESSR
jgi:hypothetical protein